MTSSCDHALGAVLGAFIGDASGAVLEFFPGEIKEDHVEQAMTLPGGGMFQVGKGQITDDSELALCLGRALASSSILPAQGFPLDEVASKYMEWEASKPFDIGNTCAAAFSLSSSVEKERRGEAMRESSRTHNMDSQANGALMRVTPLAVWAHRLPSESIVHYAQLDASLSHPSPVCLECNAAYCLAIAHLLIHPGDAEGAFAAAQKWVETHASELVLEWLKEAESLQSLERLDCKHHIGWVKWAFILCFYFLKRRCSYRDGIKATLLKGGDTDTNAAIVGGMLGALHGFASIENEAMRVINRDYSKGRSRPDPFYPKDAIELVTALYEQARSVR